MCAWCEIEKIIIQGKYEKSLRAYTNAAEVIGVRQMYEMM